MAKRKHYDLEQYRGSIEPIYLGKVSNDRLELYLNRLDYETVRVIETLYYFGYYRRWRSFDIAMEYLEQEGELKEWIIDNIRSKLSSGMFEFRAGVDKAGLRVKGI